MNGPVERQEVLMSCKTAGVKIMVPASILFIAFALGGDAHADKSSPGIKSSLSSSRQDSFTNPGAPVPDNNGLKAADAGAVEWIDRPGNNLIFGSAFLGVLAVAPFVTSLTFYGYSVNAECKSGQVCDSGIDKMVGGLSLALTGVLLFPSIMLGVIGHIRAEEAEKTKKQSRLEPFINPLMERKNDNIALDGAVFGLKGAF
jgi:hypothetical protein